MSLVKITAPASWAICVVPSVEPPSEMITSLIMPSISPVIREAKVAGSVLLAFSVGMMTESMVANLLALLWFSKGEIV